MKTPHAIAEIWKQLHDVTAERDALEVRNRQLETEQTQQALLIEHQRGYIDRLHNRIHAMQQPWYWRVRQWLLARWQEWRTRDLPF